MKTSFAYIICLGLLVCLGYSCKKSDNSPVLSSNNLYIDAINGNDTLGNGSQNQPFRSFSRAMDSLQSGDVLYVNNGNYGDVVAGRTPGLNWGFDQSKITMPYSKFTAWVTVKAAPGQTPHLHSLSIGSLNIPYSGSPSKQLDFAQKGNCDLYMSFEGLVIDSGVIIHGSRYVKIKDCIVNMMGDLNGSVSNIDNKAGIAIQNGRYITLENNEITHVSIGIAAGSYDLVIKNNHIHHNSHDGIRVWGGDGWLIEGNRIHDLDDGVDDSGPTWNRHVDGIQIWPLFDDTKNLIIRGNIFYHLEAMGIMTQTETAAENWTFENNIFGPVGGILFHLGTDVYKNCIFRHNTVVYAPHDEWVSIYNRTMNNQQYKFALWSVTAINPGYQFYNNIFTSDVSVPSDYGFVSNNIFYNYNGTDACPYEAIPGSISEYIASGKIPGTLISGSAAIDAGTAKYSRQLTIDFNGKTRDSKPDIGALEN
jgi:hypothetical protein